MMKADLQLFGGRGGGTGKSSGGKIGNGSADGALADSKARKIEGLYRKGDYLQEVLEAKTDGKGNITFDYVSPVEWETVSRTTKKVTYEIAHGAVNGEAFGINWDKVQSVSGHTYKLREEARNHGLKWDGARKKWVRK